MARSEDIEVHPPSAERYGHILSPEALDFVLSLDSN